MQIILQPVLIQPGMGLISKLEKVLSEEFNSSVSTALPIREIPFQLFYKKRSLWINIDRIEQQQE